MEKTFPTLSLNLDPDFNPTNYPSIPFESKKFSGGEQHFKLLDRVDTKRVVVTQRIKNGDDLMQLMVAYDSLRQMGVSKMELVIPYLPYARQDRICDTGESFSLKVFTNIINSMKFRKVHILDCHSEVGPALLENCVNHSNVQYAADPFRFLNGNGQIPFLVSPDAGASKKSEKLFTALVNDYNMRIEDIVQCSKKRDLKTGKLSGFTVFSENLMGKPCVIVDDICDAGGTFLGLAEELKKKNAGEIILFVTHGIFSKGLSPFEENFSRIYTTDSFCSLKESETLIQSKIFIDL